MPKRIGKNRPLTAKKLITDIVDKIVFSVDYEF